MKRLLFLLSLLFAISAKAVPNVYVGMFTNLGNYVFDQVNTPITNGAIMTATPTGSGPLTQDPGVYTYKFSYVSALGETELSGILGGDMDIGPTAQNESLTGIPTSTDSRVLRRNIWRFNPSDSLFHYVGTLSNNTATTFLDTTSDATATANAYRTNDFNSTATFFYQDTNRVPSWYLEAVNVAQPRWRLVSHFGRDILNLRDDNIATTSGGGIVYVGDPDAITAIANQMVGTNVYSDPRATWEYGHVPTNGNNYYVWRLRGPDMRYSPYGVGANGNVRMWGARGYDTYWGDTNSGAHFNFGTNFYWTNGINGLLLATLSSNGNFTILGNFSGGLSGATGLPATALPALTGAITTSAGSAATSLGSFTSAALGTAVSDETGSGPLVFATNPVISMVQFPTNALSTWPTAPSTRGGAAFVNSNATVYLLTSSPASLTWAATNKIAGP